MLIEVIMIKIEFILTVIHNYFIRVGFTKGKKFMYFNFIVISWYFVINYFIIIAINIIIVTFVI